MTYRGSSGLGADGAVLTPAQIGYLMQQIVTMEGCSPALRSNLAAMPCLTRTHMQWFGSCFLGQTPPGMNDMQFAAACGALADCGAFEKPGCAGDAPPEGSIPACAQAGQTQEILDYFRQNPTFHGPNPGLNAAGWAVSRYPAYYQHLMATPPCGAAATGPAPSAPAAPDQTPITPIAPPGMIPDEPLPGPQESGMGSYALYGVLGLAALGGAYFLLRKK